MELVARVVTVGEAQHGILERQQLARIDFERKVKVEGPVARRLRMQVDLPGLPQRVGLDEVALVVHVEAVIGGVVLQVGDEAGHVDDGHTATSLPR